MYLKSRHTPAPIDDGADSAVKIAVDHAFASLYEAALFSFSSYNHRIATRASLFAELGLAMLRQRQIRVFLTDKDSGYCLANRPQILDVKKRLG